MTYRVRIEIWGIGIRYPANVNQTAHLTRDVEQARRYHNPLNADIAAGEWERTLADLGHQATATVEEWGTPE